MLGYDRMATGKWFGRSQYFSLLMSVDRFLARLAEWPKAVELPKIASRFLLVKLGFFVHLTLLTLSKAYHVLLEPVLLALLQLKAGRVK